MVVGANDGDEDASTGPRREQGDGHKHTIGARGNQKEENRFGTCWSRDEEDGLSIAKASISLSAGAQRFKADDAPFVHGHGKALAKDPRLTLFQHDERIIQCLNHRRRGPVPRRGTKEDAARELRSLVGNAESSRKAQWSSGWGTNVVAKVETGGCECYTRNIPWTRPAGTGVRDGSAKMIPGGLFFAQNLSGFSDALDMDFDVKILL
ncbi:hypothetical protein B0H14DRAFT_3164424 [Mycena olivaceomarginata]|nr:hypothetical protein B0H14DRAFT_3164424 [Mycena olivaceomarginata]